MYDPVSWCCGLLGLNCTEVSWWNNKGISSESPHLVVRGLGIYLLALVLPEWSVTIGNMISLTFPERDPLAFLWLRPQIERGTLGKKVEVGDYHQTAGDTWDGLLGRHTWDSPDVWGKLQSMIAHGIGWLTVGSEDCAVLEQRHCVLSCLWPVYCCLQWTGHGTTDNQAAAARLRSYKWET